MLSGTGEWGIAFWSGKKEGPCLSRMGQAIGIRSEGVGGKVDGSTA